MTQKIDFKNIKLNIEYKKVQELIPYENNPRVIKDKDVKKVGNSIKRYGFINPVVINSKNVIVCGHTRLKAALDLKIEEVPTVNIDHLPEELQKEYRIVDNATGALSAWDEEKLELEVVDLKIDMNDYGLKIKFNTEVTEDEAPPPPEKPQTKLGDLYEFGGHRLLCGDGTFITDVGILMNEQKADMVFTDPPYNVGYEGNNWSSRKIKTGRPDWEGGIKNDKQSRDKFKEFLLNAYTSMDNFLKGGSCIYICYAPGKDGWDFIYAFDKLEWHFQSSLVWKKGHLLVSRWDYHPIYEPILYGWKKGAKHNFFGNRNQSNILEHASAIRQKEAGFHPTQKPISLISQCINNSSKNEDIILDPFLGSGSTLIACEQTKRKCFGIEIDPKYVDICVERYCKFTGNMNIIRNGQKVCWETKTNE